MTIAGALTCIGNVLNIYNIGFAHGHYRYPDTLSFYRGVMNVLKDYPNVTGVMCITNPTQDKEKVYLKELGFRGYLVDGYLEFHLIEPKLLLDNSLQKKLKEYEEKEKRDFEDYFKKLYPKPRVDNEIPIGDTVRHKKAPIHYLVTGIEGGIYYLMSKPSTVRLEHFLNWKSYSPLAYYLVDLNLAYVRIE